MKVVETFIRLQLTRAGVVPEADAIRITCAYREFSDECDKRGYVFQPSGWVPYPPATVAAAILAMARRARDRTGDAELIERIELPRFLSLARITSEPFHQFINYCEKSPEARSAYAKYWRRAHSRMSVVERALRLAWVRDCNHSTSETVLIPRQLQNRWHILDSEEAVNVLQAFGEVHSQGSRGVTEEQVAAALKRRSPESWLRFADRSAVETVTRALAAAAIDTETGRITGGTRDTCVVQAMFIGEVPSATMLRRHGISEPREIIRHTAARDEQEYCREYWSFGFDCYERAFRTFLSRV